MCRNVSNILAKEGDASVCLLEKAVYRMHNGGFACAVCTDESNDLALVNLEGNTLNSLNKAVVYLKILDLK